MPWDYCYEWDGPYGTRKFSVARWNDRAPTRSVALFTALEMEKYATAAAEAARADEREAIAQMLENLPLAHAGRADLTADQCVAAIRARGKP
jgi:hypothetical protein